jgi:hypothetical protein
MIYPKTKIPWDIIKAPLFPKILDIQVTVGMTIKVFNFICSLHYDILWHKFIASIDLTLRMSRN